MLALRERGASHKVFVIPARTHSQDLALHRHRPPLLVAFNPGVLHVDSFAKYAVAFFRMSRSIFTRANSARNRLNSICSALTGLSGIPTKRPWPCALTQLCSVWSAIPSVRDTAAML